jgi:hypothetical protein
MFCNFAFSADWRRLICWRRLEYVAGNHVRLKPWLVTRVNYPEVWVGVAIDVETGEEVPSPWFPPGASVEDCWSALARTPIWAAWGFDLGPPSRTTDGRYSPPTSMVFLPDGRAVTVHGGEFINVWSAEPVRR